jgi:hypothetical protein
VAIREGIDQKVTPCKLEGIVIGRRWKFKRKTIGCRRYIIEEGFLEG